jgi:predicted secreted protein
MAQMTKLFISAALLASAAAAAAETPKPAPAPAPVPAGEKKICKMITTVGTLSMRKRVCATALEWEQRRRDAQDYARDVVNGDTTANQDPPGD